MITRGDKFIFTSGNHVFFHNGIVGLDGDLSVYSGYDVCIHDSDKNAIDCLLSPEDLIELANHMILRWTFFKSAVGSYEQKE